MKNMQHLKHSQLCVEVRSWYRSSAPQLGIRVEQRRFGVFRTNATNPASARVVLHDLRSEEIPRMLAEARDYFGARDIDIWIDDRTADHGLRPALLKAGCTLGEATTYLAHVGTVPAAARAPEVSIEPVTQSLMKEFAITRLKGFANCEEEPGSEPLALEIALRNSELRGPGRFFIARVGGEAAAIVGDYSGNDVLVFILATRLPFRNRGLARTLLCGVLADAQTQSCRSVIINTNPADTPITWYRRLGFIDEVYWYQTYRYCSGR